MTRLTHLRGRIAGAAALAGVALLVAACGSSASSKPATKSSTAGAASASAPAAGGSTAISLRSTRLGRILVASNGHTLYAFSRDARNQDRCAMVSGCTRVWPIMAAHGKPKAGSGVKSSLLGTITVGHVSQVTYAGHPLYTYTADSGPADTSYVGVSQFGGTWPAVSATGSAITSNAGGASSSTAGSSGGGY